jgi:HK97 family phage major capsid protein
MANSLKRQIRLAHRTDTRPIYNETAPSMADVIKAVEAVQLNFAAFKEQNDKALKEVAKGKDDVVTREHVDRVNADLGKNTAALEDLQRKIAALSVSGESGDNKSTPERRQHRKAFNTFVRKGTNEGELKALEVKAALSTDSDPDGGFVVPEETDATISRALEVVSAIRRLADVQVVGTSQYKALHNLGSAGGGWVGEQQSRAETTTPRLVEMTFPMGEVYAMPGATQSMLDDARINVDQWLADEVNRTFAEYENAAFVTGNGVNRPKGFIDTTNGVVANASWAWGKVGFVTSGASGAFVTTSATANAYDKLLDLYHALRAGYRGNAAWLMSDATLAEVRKVKDNDGAYIYLPPTSAEPGSILGKTVEIEDNMPTIGANSFSIAFADWKRAYKVLDRFGTRVLRDPFSNKPYVMFYTTKRVGGGIRDYEAIKLMKFST